MKLILPVFLLLSATAFCQSIQGVVLNEKDKSPVAFAKIAVTNTKLGTVSDKKGRFSIQIDNKYNKDSIRFSCVGFLPFTINVSDYRHLGVKTTYLKEKAPADAPQYEVSETAQPITYGVIGHSGIIEIKGGVPGSEAGVLFNFSVPSQLQKLTLHVDTCSLDTIFFRVNVYRPLAEKKFQNILKKPVYYKSAGNNLQGKSFDIDLSGDNIWVKGKMLITIEQIKTFNKGTIRFTGKSGGLTYGRKASTASWRTVPTTMSMLVEARPAK